MNQEEMQKNMLEFERSRAQLVNISNQKRQMQLQNSTLKKAIEELGKTEEKKVYKAVGNILIFKDVKEVKKELKDQQESMDLRVKTMQKQEDALIDRLNKLKSELEAATGAAGAAPAGGEATEAKEEEEKKSKESKK